MPTLTAASRADNIEKSINAFVSTWVETALGLQVHYPRSAPWTSFPVRWLDMDMMTLFPQTRVMRMDGDTSRGTIRDYLINANCFEKDEAIRTGDATLYSLSTMVEDVRQVFMPPASIPILDFDTGGTPQVGALEAIKTPDVTRIDTDTNKQLGITQVNLSITLSYVDEALVA